MVGIPLFILLFVNEATRKRGEDPVFYSMKEVSCKSLI
jgi:hypothetical protein